MYVQLHVWSTGRLFEFIRKATSLHPKAGFSGEDTSLVKQQMGFEPGSVGLHCSMVECHGHKLTRSYNLLGYQQLLSCSGMNRGVRGHCYHVNDMKGQENVESSLRASCLQVQQRSRFWNWSFLHGFVSCGIVSKPLLCFMWGRTLYKISGDHDVINKLQNKLQSICMASPPPPPPTNPTRCPQPRITWYLKKGCQWEGH